MTDFGANIFDDDNTPRPPKSRRTEPARQPADAAASPAAPPKAAVPPPEPPRVQEVPLEAKTWVHDDTVQAEFAGGAPVVEAPRQPAAEPQPNQGRRAEPPRPARDPRGTDRPAATPREPDARDPRGPRDEHAPRHQRHERYERPVRPEPSQRSDRPDAPERHRRGDEGLRGDPRDRHHDRPRHDDRTRPERQDPGTPQATARPAPAPAPASEPAAPAKAAPAVRAVAILVDLNELQAEARAQGGELAVHRLRNGLAGDRVVDRAVCFASRGVTPPSGFELTPCENSIADGIQFAATALDLVGAAGQLVLAPPSAAIQQLATALRNRGHRVELAGFVARGAEGQTTRRLGRDCLFVP